MCSNKIIIQVCDEFKNSCPTFIGAAVFASVENSEYNDELWKEINLFIDKYRSSHRIEDVKNNNAIAATREAYKRLGKDPNRYRVSSESLCRRIVKEKSLYNVNTLVDLINWVSMFSGYSIGGFDLDKIDGDNLTLGIGKESEPYEGIGRGMLNIEFLPVYKDSMGGVGTPTSDNERTKLDKDSQHLLAIINSYDGDKTHLKETAEWLCFLLTKYAKAEYTEIIIFDK